MSKIIFSGLESSGKSLKLAMVAEKVLFRNAKWLQESGIMRPIVTNAPFSEAFMQTAKELGITIHYWENLDDLISYKDADIFIDEIGTYFDARLWTELSIDVRRWIQQGAKMGIELYGACQDFSQVDIAFRRLTSELFYITKLFGSPRPSNTKPPIKHIWGVCLMRELNPQNYDEKKKEFTQVSIFNLPRFFLIRKQNCELFDTKFFIQRSKPLALKHLERKCFDCGIIKTSHI